MVYGAHSRVNLVSGDPLGTDQGSEKTGSKSSTLGVSAHLEGINNAGRGGGGQWEKEDGESENGISEWVKLVHRGSRG